MESSSKSSSSVNPGPIRIVTATSLFDGHDAAINVMRRILQSSGAEVIHLGHNRRAEELVDVAIQEDAHAIAITSYQGGHIEYFKYILDLLKAKGSPEIKVFGGGGGVILPSEAYELERAGVCKIYTPDDGRTMGLQGMIDHLLKHSQFNRGEVTKNNWESLIQGVLNGNHKSLASSISLVENSDPTSATEFINLLNLKFKASQKQSPKVLGITGTGGAGKSSIIDELIRRSLNESPERKIAVLSVDPSKRKTGGALLGDRIRMNSVSNPHIYMRSMATRQSNLALSKHVATSLEILKSAGFDLIILETSGIGQSDTEIVEHSNVSLYVMTPEFGAPTQLEKIDMIDFADTIIINKFDRKGARDALRDVRKQYRRSRKQFDGSVPDEDLPIFGTIASQFNDAGMNSAYAHLFGILFERTPNKTSGLLPAVEKSNLHSGSILPPSKMRYLSEISKTIRDFNQWTKEQSELVSKKQSLEQTMLLLKEKGPVPSEISTLLQSTSKNIDPLNQEALNNFYVKKEQYLKPEYSYKVRGKDVFVKTSSPSLSQTDIPKVIFPHYRDQGDLLRWILQENIPGEFPYTAGTFPFKRENEDPARMFAGEGGPERTNRRFHYLSFGMPAQRLSTAFDSVTLYGEDPSIRPDIYGKVGNSGVSICCLDDAKKLYSGFDLCCPTTSVSMTINGPAPMLLSFFLNAAVDQQCELYIKSNGLTDQVEKALRAKFNDKNIPRPKYDGPLPQGHSGLGLLLLGLTGDEVLPQDIYLKIKSETLKQVRGTVQADILKEDQAQNTCIFSTEFALKMMGDVQEYFIKNEVRNFYSVSISGYHIAEAGANPITQLAFTLANGFTYLEYYLSRNMPVDQFAPNFSFFFSNGLDPEYAVIGRVARRIWAKALKLKYGAQPRSQMLKYHIQTSGRSLHAQEIAFNDIRTTLQALYALFDQCNSLHTNAYDEAITTPTEESVRRAMAIQLILNHEFGLSKNQNPWQGSFVIEWLTDKIEEAVLEEFDRITERGGVLGAMETMYQRGKIQEESLHYETLKHDGKLPLIGVNTFLSKEGSPTVLPKEVIRSTEQERNRQVETVQNLWKRNATKASESYKKLQTACLNNENIFEQLLEASKTLSLGQLSDCLYKAGGEYRRNM